MNDPKKATKFVIGFLVILALLIISIVLLAKNDKDKPREFKIVMKEETVAECQNDYLFIKEDTQARYYVDCKYAYYVEVNDKEYKIREAIKNDFLSVDDIILQGIKVYKYETSSED